TAFARSTVAYAAESAEIATRRHDGYARAWMAAHRDACQATHVRGDQSAELLDLRVECLDDRLRDLKALVRALGGADATTIKNATRAVGSLPDLSPCSDRRGLRERAIPPADPVARAEVASLRDRLSQARAFEMAGRMAEAGATADAVLVEARSL